MRKLLISAAMATATIATAVPTAAMAQQGYGQRDHGQRGGWHRGGPTRAQVADLIRDLGRAEQRIDRAPGISRREAMSLRREAASIRFQLNRAHRNGISQREFNVLRSQVNRLQMRVRMENRDRDQRRY